VLDVFQIKLSIESKNVFLFIMEFDHFWVTSGLGDVVWCLYWIKLDTPPKAKSS